MGGTQSKYATSFLLLLREDLRPADSGSNPGEMVIVRQVSQASGNVRADVPALPPIASSSRPQTIVRERPIRQRLTTAREERRRHRASVEKILFLQSRISDPQTATLFAAGAEGWVRAWSIHHRGGLLGQWIASHFAGDTVSSMATDPDNFYLITGDSSGYVKVWDMTNYCVSNNPKQPGFDESPEEKTERLDAFVFYHFEQMPVVQELKGEYYRRFPSRPDPPASSAPERTLKQPQLVNSFRAHVRAITSVEYVPERELLLTTSLDHSVRVWTLTGRFVGTLGQKDPWLLAKDGRIVPETLPERKPFDIRRSGKSFLACS